MCSVTCQHTLNDHVSFTTGARGKPSYSLSIPILHHLFVCITFFFLVFRYKNFLTLNLFILYIYFVVKRDEYLIKIILLTGEFCLCRSTRCGVLRQVQVTGQV